MKSRVSDPLWVLNLPTYLKPVSDRDIDDLRAEQIYARAIFEKAGFKLLPDFLPKKRVPV